jgi:hypothetical protein
LQWTLQVAEKLQNQPAVCLGKTSVVPFVFVRPAGTPQGGPLSPLLSNIRLDDLGRFLEGRGLSFCRYADHCNIYFGSRRAGEQVMQEVTAFVEEVLKLKINASKSAVARPWERKFLGYSVTWHKKPKLKIAEASRKRLVEKVRTTLRKARGGSLQRAIERLNPLLRGWVAYFRLTEVKGCIGGTRWLDQAQAADASVAAKEAGLHAGKESDADGERKQKGLALCHQRAWPVVERRFAHERRLSEVLVRPDGVGFVAGNPATPYICFMNRWMPNGTSFGVGGRRE